MVDMADDSMDDENTQPTGNNENNYADGDIHDDSEEDIDDDDFDSLNLQLDQLSSALDVLEQKNDHIQEQLVRLLESNRETRQQFQETLAKQQNPNPQL